MALRNTSGTSGGTSGGTSQPKEFKPPTIADAPDSGPDQSQMGIGVDTDPEGDDPEVDTYADFGPDPRQETHGFMTDTGDEQPSADEAMHRVEVLTHDAIINGHKINHGHVVGPMSMTDILNHRRHGVALSDPLDDDHPKVRQLRKEGKRNGVHVDVSEPFQPQQLDKDGNPVGTEQSVDNEDRVA